MDNQNTLAQWEQWIMGMRVDTLMFYAAVGFFRAPRRRTGQAGAHHHRKFFRAES